MHNRPSRSIAMKEYRIFTKLLFAATGKKPQMANGNVNGNGKYIREFRIFHYFGHCIIVTSCSRFLSECQSQHGLVRNHRFGFSTPKDRNWLYCSMANEIIWPLCATAFYYSSSSCTLPRLLSLTWAKRITNDYFAFSFFLILFWVFCIGFFSLKFDFGFDFEFDISIEFNLALNSWIQIKLLSVLLAILVYRYNTFFHWTPNENDWD